MTRAALLAWLVLDADQPVADTALGNDMLGLGRIAFEPLARVSHVDAQEGRCHVDGSVG
jgi:hypothetical protein